jgi:hypothetical protein
MRKRLDRARYIVDSSGAEIPSQMRDKFWTEIQKQRNPAEVYNEY